MHNAQAPAHWPPDWAFVVQLRGATPFAAALLHGRIEHVATGRACNFESLEALRAFMELVLAPAPGSAPLPPAPP